MSTTSSSRHESLADKPNSTQMEEFPSTEQIPDKADAGTSSPDHYQLHLSPFRYYLRSLLLPIIRHETDILSSIQKFMRHPWLDFYFAWTANLASHTFYVLMLPVPVWFGASNLARDLVYVLGLGIFFTGHLKDYLCLPRPRSPPIHRITMSSYTTQEYGFPSSHSANATGVTLLFCASVAQSTTLSFESKLILYTGLLIYYLSLIFGRIYCGMHGFLDILVGGTVGLLIFLFRFYLGAQWDQWLLADHSGIWLFAKPMMIVFGYIGLIHFHSQPVDDCPCFDDSVAFIGVLIGLDLSHWLFKATNYLTYKNPYADPLLINFDYSQLGLFKTICRVIVGICLVSTWKAAAKPVVFTILPPIYKYIGLCIPRSNFLNTASSTLENKKIRSQSISNINKSDVADINSFIKGVTDHHQVDGIGPNSDIDKYEILAYSASKGEKGPSDIKISGVFKPRYDVEVVGRLVVYAGITITTLWGFCLASEYLDIA